MMMALAVILALSQGSAPASCDLTKQDIEANRLLSFADFDQRGVTMTTARKLGERGCDLQAAVATEDYLLFGPNVTEYEQNVLSWHLAQYLAAAGREGEAARVISTTRRPPREEPDGFDWSNYVIGTWAFLVKDRAALDRASGILSDAPGARNSMNARVLRRLQKCFDRSYQVAYQHDDCSVDP